MYLIPIGWLYVALMMAAAEASSGTLLGAAITFVLYGALPVALLLYLMGHPGRRRARLAREAAELAEWRARNPAPAAADAASGGAPDGGGEAPADPVAPVRKEP
ncbi:MAG: hypothetical protein V4864_22035 [Pseudomonadota bacterium]